VNDGATGLLVDVQTVQGGFFGNRGIRRYAIGFARALSSRGVVRTLLLNPSAPSHEEIPSEIRNSGELSWSTRRNLRALDGSEVAYVMTSPFERALPVESAIPSYVLESAMPTVAVLYDLIPEIVDVYPPELMPAYWARRRIVQGVDLLLTLSEHVRRCAIERLGVPDERVAVIGAAVSDYFRPRRPGEQPQAVLAAQVPRVTRPFVLSVTGWSASKNVEGLVEAWARLPRPVRADRQLVLTCPLPPGAESAWSDLAGGLGLAPDDVVVTGQVDDAVVRALYQEAELSVLPSYEEGFGLPVLEAARCGCPAITSRTSSLPEVLDWEPATFPPERVDAIAEVLERGVLDPGFRSDLHAVGAAAAARHTWDRVAERTIRACSAMPALDRPRRAAPPRIAFVGAFTPADGPTATAVDRVVPFLAANGHVDRFDTATTTDPGARRSAPRVRRDGVGSYPARALGQQCDPWGYDAIVYVVDAHPGPELVRLAETCPGVPWFVDAPRDRRVAVDLARGAMAIVRQSDVPDLAVDPGPFGRSRPVVPVPADGASAARALLDVIGPRRPVTRPVPAR